MSEGQLRATGGALLLATTFLLSLFLLRAPGTLDVSTFLKWMSIVHEEGLVDGYATIVANFPKTVTVAPAYVHGGGEYPPLAYVILYWARWFGDLGALTPFLSLKLMLLIFHWIAVILILAASKNLLLAAAFSAATLLTDVGLGYLDILFAPTLIAAFWLAGTGRHLLGLGFLLVSVLTKWQPLIVMPFFAMYLFDASSLEAIRATLKRRLFRQAFALGAIAILVPVLLFGTSMPTALKYAMNHHYLSGLAMNLPWLEAYVLKVLFHPTFAIGSEMTPPVPPALLQWPIKFMFWIAFTLVLVRAAKSERTVENCLRFSLLGSLVYCTLNTGVHENHWTLPMFLAFILLTREKSYANWIICVLVVSVANVNPFFFFGIAGQPVQAAVLGIDLSIPFAMVCVGISSTVALYVWKATARDRATSADRVAASLQTNA